MCLLLKSHKLLFPVKKRTDNSYALCLYQLWKLIVSACLVTETHAFRNESNWAFNSECFLLKPLIG